MISYEPLWNTLKKKNRSTYYISHNGFLSRSIIHKLKHNEVVTTKTIDTLCNILDCSVEDVMIYIKD